jgi:hypothetical protein
VEGLAEDIAQVYGVGQLLGGAKDVGGTVGVVRAPADVERIREK